MIELQTVTTKAKNPSTNEFQDVTWGGINVISTSGTTNYNNLTNKPTINGVTVQGSLTTGDLLITAADVGALPSGTKYGADLALSIDSQTFIVTAQLKDQDGNNLGQAKTIDLPLETMVVGGSYDDTTQKVILTLKNGQTVEFSVADLISGLQSEITLNNKLDADLIDDSASTNKLVTASEKATWNAKQNALTFDGTYDASTNKAATVSTVTNAINDLDVSSVGGSGKYISAISETNGKISPTAETMDTTPTSGSEKAVTSGAVYTALGSKQDALTTAQLAAANSGITAAKLTADKTALGEVINSGAAGTKNLLIYTLSTLQTQNNGSAYGFSWSGNVCTTNRGVTFTVNSDMSIRVQANATNDVWFLLENHSFDVGTWMLSGCPADGGTSKYYIESDNINARDIGSGVQISAATNLTDNIYIIVKSGQSFDLTFKPMLCRKALYDVNPDYEPYAPAKTNVEITPALVEVVDAGAKNFVRLGFTSTSGSSSVPATTNNNDGTITVNGSRVGAATILVQDLITAKTSSVNTRYTLPAGSYVIAPTGNVNIGLQVYKHDGTNLVGLGNSRLTPLSFTYSEADKVQYPYICIRLYCEGTVTINNFTFMPMICTAADWNVSQKYVPYLKPYSEIGRLGYHIETVALNSVTITKSINGIFYTSAIDVSDKFDLLLGATLNNFGNLQSNIAIMPTIKPDDKTYSLWICDSTNPQTLPVSASSQVKVVLYGILKG